jgi:hypothetical protein
MNTASPKLRITTGQSASLAAQEKAPPKRGFMTGYNDNTEGDSGVRYASDQCVFVYYRAITMYNYK